MRLPVDFFAMTDPQNRHHFCGVIYLVDDSIVSDSNPPTGMVRQLSAARRSGLATQAVDPFLDGFVRFGIERRKFFSARGSMRSA